MDKQATKVFCECVSFSTHMTAAESGQGLSNRRAFSCSPLQHTHIQQACLSRRLLLHRRGFELGDIQRSSPGIL